VVVRRRLDRARGDLLFPALERAGDKPAIMPSRFVRLLKQTMRWTLWSIQAGEDDFGPRLADMERWKLHGLRHTIATHMTEDLRVEENVVSLILGHAVSGPSVSRVYNRAERLAERRAALVAWGSWVDAVAEGKPGATVLPMVR
jgi:integrase